jgi:hypothetical protein
MSAGPADGAAAVRAARAELRALYAELDADIAALAPRCDLSGRCCHFKDYGHDLFVTTLELAELVGLHGWPPQAEGSGQCPYQRGLACTAREGRPLGCRIFYCDPTYEAAMHAITERYHARVKVIHERFGLTYEYGEILRALERFAP